MPSSFNIFLKSIICCSLWCMCSGDFLKLWSQTCQVHADNKHEEFKGILEQKDKFNTNNWSHATLLAILVLLSSLTFIVCCCCAVKYGRIVLSALKLRNNQKLGTLPLFDQQPNHPPYNTQPAFMGRPLQIVSNSNRRTTEGNLEV